MKVINLIGQPGAGKSTVAAGLFFEMKRRGCNVELVTEYTKDVIYENHAFVLEDELLVFSEKYKRIKRLSRSVDYVITDSPLLNSLFYSEQYGETGKAFFRSVAEQFDNLYVFVNRVVPYVPHARITDAALADRIGERIRAWLVAQGISFFEVNGDDHAPATVMARLEAAGLVAGGRSIAA